MSEEGYKMDESTIEAVQGLKERVPSSIADIRHILGLIGYHRRHIRNFIKRAKPITDLLKSSEVKTKATGISMVKEKQRRKDRLNWTEECQSALELLIDDICQAPILAYPDFTKEFILHTDASQLGLGAILYQNQDEQMKVIAYASRTLDKCEGNYHATKLEFLALKWAITDKFREYLGYADHFCVFTDNNPLVYLMDSKKLNAFGERWLSELSEYNFSIRYRPGILHHTAYHDYQ